mgnify:CR=1 FL=1
MELGSIEQEAGFNHNFREEAAMETNNLHGYFFEDFQVGDLFWSPGRTITEYDVMAFAGISFVTTEPAPTTT